MVQLINSLWISKIHLHYHRHSNVQTSSCLNLERRTNLQVPEWHQLLPQNTASFLRSFLWLCSRLMLRSEARSLFSSPCLPSSLLKIVAWVGDPCVWRERDSRRRIKSLSAFRISSPTRNWMTFSPWHDSDFNPLSLLGGLEAEEGSGARSWTVPATIRYQFN